MSSGTYYLLNENICLRGYDKLPYALMRRPDNSVMFVDKNLFWALSLCDGQTDLSLPIYPAAVFANIRELERNKIIHPCEYGASLTEDQKYRLYPNRYIDSAHWSITGRCNFRCRHCYMSAPEAKLGELTHEQIMDIIDQFEACGIQKTTLTGGEPLVRRDFEDIVRELSRRRIVITQIYSNGALVNDKLLDMLEYYGQKPEFNMSYDGDEGMHDWLRGIPHAGDMVLRAFDLCYDRGFPTGSELCLFQKNKHLLRQSLSTLGAHHVGSCKVNPVSESELWLRTTGENQTLAMEECFELYLDYLPHYFEDGEPVALMLGGFFLGHGDGSKTYRIPIEKYPADFDCSRMTLCGHARSQVYISPESRMLPCLSLSSFDEIQAGFPKITDIGLQAGLTDSSYMQLIDMRLEEFFKVNQTCGACEYRVRCGGSCRACALGLSGGKDLLASDPAACLYFKGGYDKRIRQVLAGIAEIG